MKIETRTIRTKTDGPGLADITHPAAEAVTGSGIRTGQATLFIRHTSASLVIQENADPDVLADLQDFLAGLAPWAEGRYRHSAEGPDDMPAHIRAALTQTSLTIPILDGRLGLGTWQGIYLWEHREGGHRREVVVSLLGDT